MTTDVYVGGLPFSSAGALQVLARPAGGVGANVAKVRGIAVELAGGMVYVEDAGTAVPSTAFYMGGIALTPDGAIYVTQSTSGSFVWTEGVKVRSDGAVAVTNGAPVAGTWGLLGAQGANGGVAIEGLTFAINLQTSMVPWIAAGSSTPTYTRASPAHQTDFEGKLNAVQSGEARFEGGRRVRNLIAGASRDYTNGSWTKGALGAGSVPTVTANYAAGPDGSVTASRVQFDAGGAGAGDRSYITQNSSEAAIGKIVSTVWMKSNTGASQTIDLQADSSNTVVVTVTTSWQRFAYSSNAGNATHNNLFGLRGSTTAQTADILVWDALCVNVTGVTNVNPPEDVSVGVLSAPFHGAGVDGVKYFDTLNGNTVASNVVTEATGAAIVTGASGVAATAPVDANGPFGEFSDPAQTDVLGTTAAIRRTMADAGWVASNITKGAATGADGVGSAAASLTASAGNGTVLYTTVLGAAVRTYFALVRRKTGTGTINITGDNGVTWTVITLTTAYQPFYFTTASAANPVVGFRIVTSGDAIEVDFNTLVAGSNKPPIPTPVNVNQAATVPQYVSSGNVPTNDFVLYGESEFPVVQPAASYFLWASYVDANNYTAVLWDGTNLIARKRISAASNDATIALTPTAGTVFKWAARFTSTTGTDIFLNGTKGTNDATNTACQIGTNFQELADGNGANQPYATSRYRRNYSRALPDSVIQTMTA